MQAATYKQHLTQLYEEPTQVSSRQLQRNYVKEAKLQNHLTFLKHCRDSSITPTGLQLKSSISNPQSKLIIHKAGQALVRERIANTRPPSIPYHGARHPNIRSKSLPTTGTSWSSEMPGFQHLYSWENFPVNPTEADRQIQQTSS